MQTVAPIRFKKHRDLSREHTTTIEFDFRLQHKGQDSHYYANTGVAHIPAHHETDVLHAILRALFTDRSGVEHVKVTPFKIEIDHTTVVTARSILDLIEAAIRKAGYEAERVER